LAVLVTFVVIYNIVGCFVGAKKRKIKLAAEIAESIAQSASEHHDPFGFIGFDEKVREDWISATSFKSHHAIAMAESLKDFHPAPVNCNGITEVYRYLPRERCLVFLISDFHMPNDLLEEGLSNLLKHYIVPVVLWDAAEYRNLPEFGLANVTDAETGEKRTLFIRKELREKIVQSFESRREEIYELFMRFDMPPFYVEGEFDPDLMTEYFHQSVAA
jgi:uncharacterized protein (DUF58 family)